MDAVVDTRLTEALVASMAGSRSPRIRDVSQALVRHLHAFIREIEPSEAEFMWAIEFLTRTGHMCVGGRQEFILLSDTLGASMLVDEINHPAAGMATESTVLGPFYVVPPEFASGTDIRGDSEGPALYISGAVRSDDGTPIVGAVVDIWHSDPHGTYDLQRQDAGGFAGRGRFRTDDQGRYALWTVRPSSYPIPNDGPVGEMLAVQSRHPYRPEHVHFMIDAPSHRRLVTHLFAAGDRYLDSDVVFGVKESLIHPFAQYPPGPGPDGRVQDAAWYSLDADFVLARDAV